MRTQGDKILENRFRLAFKEFQKNGDGGLGIKATFGLVTLRGTVSSKALRLKIVETALGVMDQVLGEGHQRIAPNPR